MVLGGDTFQSARPHAEDVRVFRQEVNAMKQKGLSVFYIQGQHDYSDPPWPDALSDDVEWVHNRVFEPEPGVKVFALDHMKLGQMQEAMASIPEDCHIVMLHQLARQVFPLEGTWDFDAAWLPTHVTTAIMGDYHQPVSFEWAKENVGFYTGSMHVQAIDEPKDKSFVTATPIQRPSDGLQALATQRVPLVTRLYFKYPVNSEEELDALVRWLNQYNVDEQAADRGVEWDAIKQPVVEVPHLTTIKDVKSRLEAASDGKVHLWLKPFNVDMQTGPITVSDTKTRASLESCLSTFVSPETEGYTFILELLGRPSDGVFKSWRQKLRIEPEDPPENLVLEQQTEEGGDTHA